MSRIIAEFADPIAARGRADFLTRETGVKHEVTAGVNECYAVRKAPEREPVEVYVNAHIPLAEIVRALNAFGFSVGTKAGELYVDYAEPPRPMRHVIDGRFEPNESMSERTREQFLDNGWEP